MIGSAGSGAAFGGLTRYLLHGRDGQSDERVAWVSMRNLFTEDPEQVAMEMRATAEQNTRIQKPVYHLSLNLSPGEELTREKWEAVAERVLRDLGLEEHQALLVAHRDREHQHVHLVVNRVHAESRKAWSNSHDYRRIERSLREIERELGLREVPGRHHQLADQERPERSELAEGRTSGERREAERTGREPWIETVRREAAEDFREAKSWAELEHRLGKKGLWVEARGRGMVVTDGEREVKASRVARTASRGRLEERFGQRFEEWREARRGLVAAVEAIERNEAQHRTLFNGEIAASQELARMYRAEDRVRLGTSEAKWRVQALEGFLGRTYRSRDLAAAKEGIRDVAGQEGWVRAGERLAGRPEDFGRLRGRGVGRLETTERKAAREAAREAGRHVGKLGPLQEEIARDRQFLERVRPKVPEIERRRREAAVALRELPSSRLLEQNLARQVARLGMSTVRLVLDPTPMKVATAALQAFRLAQEMTRDEGRGR